MWDEEESSNTVLYNDKGQIRAGTLNKLVQALTSEKVTDLEFMKGFLMTYLAFTTPEKLLEKLVQRYHAPVPNFPSSEEEEQWRSTTLRTIQLRVCNTMKYWMDNHYQDFNHDLTEKFIAFVDEIKSSEHTDSKFVAPLQQAIVKRVRS